MVMEYQMQLRIKQVLTGETQIQTVEECLMGMNVRSNSGLLIVKGHLSTLGTLAMMSIKTM